MPADADGFTFFPVLHTGTYIINHTDDLVSGDTRIRNAGEEALFDDHITVADSTGLNADPDLSWPYLRDLPLDNFEVSTSSGNLNSFHLWHSASPSTSSWRSYAAHRKHALVCGESFHCP